MISAAPKNIVILISGRGSNMEALLNASAEGTLSGRIVRVISNRPAAMGISTAEEHGISTRVIDHTEYDSREAFDAELATEVASVKPDIVVLAGFMRILTPVFIDRFLGLLVNIHPSLLPKYPGRNTHQRAIDAGDNETGATVHFVTNELDGGPPILQAAVSIGQHDNAESLAQRTLLAEHRILPEAVNWFLEDRLHHKNDGAYLDDKRLPPTGIQWAPVP